MEKIKQFLESEIGKDILTVSIVILVGLGSFGLGRLSNTSSLPQIKANSTLASINTVASVNKASDNTSSTTTKKTNSGNYFASKNGKKYYPLGCSAGNTIKEENKIYFATEAEATAAGYEKSASCK